MKSTARIPNKIQMTVRLEPEARHAAVLRSNRTGTAVATVVADAAKQALLPRKNDTELSLEKATERILRRLGKIDAALQADSHMLREMLAIAFRIYLNHTPSVPDTERDTASMSGRLRFDQYLQVLEENLRDGISVFDASRGASSDEDEASHKQFTPAVDCR